LAKTTDDPQRLRSGYCAIVGRSNVGKSTLFNRFVGARISSTAAKPQTTRQNIRGIFTEGNAQVVFVDTPGLQRDQSGLLNSVMYRRATSVFNEVDVILLMVERDRWGEEEDNLLASVGAAKKPCLLCVNKVDTLKDKKALLPVLARLSDKYPFDELVPISAIKGSNLGVLKSKITERLPSSRDFPFPAEQLSDRDERFIVAELIREQLTRVLGQELPYALYVEICAFEDRGESTLIGAIIWVARSSQKAIVIGKSGTILKKIGSRARISIERLLSKKVYLQLWVKVKPNWQADPRIIAALTS